jgi:hypothetical protein
MLDYVISPSLHVDDTSSNSSALKAISEVVVTSSITDFATQETSSPESQSPPIIPVPLKWKLASILMVSAIGFGSNWSSGITGAMKSTIKKQMKINNTQFALLEASEDFMVTVQMMVSGLVTDRIGGAGISPPINRRKDKELMSMNE